MMSEEARAYLRLMLVFQAEGSNPQIPKLSPTEQNLAIVAAFSVAIDRALGDSPSLEEIHELVDGIRGTYVKADELQPVQAEAVVRAIFGEEALLKGIPYVDLMRIQLAITYGVVNQPSLLGTDLESYLDAVAERAEEFT